MVLSLLPRPEGQTLRADNTVRVIVEHTSTLSRLSKPQKAGSFAAEGAAAANGAAADDVLAGAGAAAATAVPA
ncbi:hypothetical protein AB0N16_31370 [Streptomyces sp. NPDC051105]|uniref:hypothetical protein n=1 Tax=Streptomyces sp. NPDC051105 TaxID=3154843 RepID=UPI00344136F7